MANPNKVWGRSRIKIDGGVIDTEGKSSLDIGGVARDEVQVDYRPGMFTESDKPAKLECSVPVTGGVSLVALGAIVDATVTMEADTGQTYIIRHAYCSEPPAVAEGKAKLTLMGPPAEEMAL